MNVRSNTEIGHPSSNYIWDIVSTAQNCFTFFDWILYVGEGYVGSARGTAAQSDRQIPANVEVIDKDITLSGPLIYATSSGDWIYCEDELNIIFDGNMPFGPVILQISGFRDVVLEFPKSMFSYLINTLERGEEPMETIGKGNYSAVSGWKAYARWMQSYSIPIRNIKHVYQKELAQIIYERRLFFTYYLTKLSEKLDGEERDMVTELSNRYNAVIEPLSRIIDEPDMRKIREVYFLEQMTLPTYKALRNYMKRRIRKN